jgi:hypothetical protein
MRRVFEKAEIVEISKAEIVEISVKLMECILQRYDCRTLAALLDGRGTGVGYGGNRSMIGRGACATVSGAGSTLQL